MKILHPLMRNTAIPQKHKHKNPPNTIIVGEYIKGLDNIYMDSL
jgi:hypothetical protein